MASNDVIVRLIADVSSLQAGMDKATKELEGLKNKTEKSTSSIGTAFKKVGTAIAGAIAVDKIKDLTVSLIEASASVNALDSMFEQTFKGEQANALSLISEQAQQQGITVDRLKGTWASFYGTFRGNGADANESLALTSRYMNLAGDASAYYDLTLEDVVSRLKSIVMGNFEAGDAIGININATKMDTIAKEKYNKAWQNLNDTEKEFLLIDTAEQIYENSGAVGQGAREADNWSNVLANLQAVWERLLGTIGQPVLKTAVGIVQDLTSKLQVAVNWVSEFKNWFDEAYKATGSFSESLASAFDMMGMDWAGDFVMGIQSVVDGIKEMVNWFKEHETVTLILASSLGILTAGIMAFNVWLKAGAISIKAMSIATGVWNTITAIGTTVTTAFGVAVAFLTSPIGIITVAIMGLVAVGILLYKNWDSVKAFLSICWEGIKTVAVAIWNGIVAFFSACWEGIKAVCIFVWEGIKLVITTVMTVISTIISTIWNGIVTAVTVVLGVLYTIISTVWNAIYTVIEPILNIIYTLIVAVWQAIQMAIALVLSVILGAITLAWEGIKLVISTAMDLISTIISTAWNFIKSIITTVLDAIKLLISTIWDSIKDKVYAVLEAISSTVSSIWNKIKDFISTVMSAISSTAISIWTSIKEKITAVVDAIRTTVSNIFSSVKSNVSSIWTGIKSTISSVIDGIKSLVSSGFNWVSSVVQSVCSGLKSAVVGIWTGIGSGIQSVVNGIISVINGMVRAMNKISFTVPDWIPVMGGKSFGFNIPTVPSVSWFQTGGIFTGASVIGVGENGDEAVVPLSNKTRMKPFAEAVASMIPDNDGSASEGTTNNYFSLNGVTVREESDIQKIAQELYKLQERNRRKRGVV